MKSVLKNYTFNSVAKTITLTDITAVRLDRLALITDTTTNTILYNFADSTVSTATVATNVVTLSTVGTAVSTDKLRIDYDVEATDAAFGDSSNATQSKTTDGTNIANVLKSDGTAAGQNSAMVAGGYQTINFTTGGTLGAQVLGPYNIGNYRSLAIQNTTTASGLAVTPQFSLDGGTTWSGSNTFQNTGNTANLAGSYIGGGTTIYTTAINASLFRLNVTALASGTYSGGIYLSVMPMTYPTMGVAAAQTGAYNTSVNATSTVTTVSVAITSTTVLSTNVGRKAIILSNVGANNIFINLAGGTAVVTNILLAANQMLYLERYVPTTAITAIAATAATNLSVTELS